MPKYKKATANAKASQVIKSYTENGFNQVATAKAEGISQPAVCKKLQNPLVQSALDKAFKKVGINTSYKARKFKELLEAKKLQTCDIYIKDDNGKLKVNKNSNDFIEVEDNHARVNTLRLLCQVQGDIKTENGNNKGNQVAIIQINYGYRNGSQDAGHSAIRNETGSSQSS